MFTFGSGALIGTQLTDSQGNALAVPQPVKFGALQDVSLDISFDIKMLYGQNWAPLAAGRGKGKFSGKAKMATLNGLLVNALFFGQTLTKGTIQGQVNDTTGTLIPATPFQITVVPPNSGTYLADLGVVDDVGLPYLKVAASPAAGQYSQAGAVYTFASADNVAGRRAFISYSYTASTGNTNAQRSTVSNQLMGYAPTFKCDFNVPYNGKQLTFSLPQCIASKLSFASKLDDFIIPEFDFECFADSSGNVMTYSSSD